MKRVPLIAALAAFLWSVPAWGQFIFLTSPAGDSVWRIGRTCTITWVSQGITGPLCIKLHQANGSSSGPVLEIATDLPPNGSYSWTVPDSVTPGDYFVRVQTVADNPLVHNDSLLFHIVSRIGKILQADLFVSNMVVSPTPPRARKDMVTIKATVVNQGHKATANLQIPCSLNMIVSRLDASGEEIGGERNTVIPNYAFNIPDLAPGASIQIAKTITLRFAGRYRISGVINTEGFHSATEEDSSNNRYEFFFEALEPPAESDLVLEGVTLTADGRLMLRLINKGDAIPDPDFDTSYVLIKVNNEDERSLKLKEIDPTGLLKKGRGNSWMPGPAIHLNYTWPGSGYKGILLQPGQSKTFQVIVDYNVRVSDSDRGNNSRTVTLSRPR